MFHLVTDETVKNSDMTSRHAVILAIRNIIKLSFRYDINTLTIPLLLSHDMLEVRIVDKSDVLVYCRTGFICPSFNFAKLIEGEFKTRANKYSHIECLVYIVTGRIQNQIFRVLHIK